MGLLQILRRVGGYVSGLWNELKTEIEDDWEVIQELELFPRRQTAEDGSVKYQGSIKVVNSTEELDISKTWIFIHRDQEENDILAWSPCDGERVMVPWTLPLEGLLLAPGTCHLIGGTSLVVDYEEEKEALYACDSDDSGQCWVYASDRASWEAFDGHRQEERSMAKAVEVEELGKVYFPLHDYNPKLQSAKVIPVEGAGLSLHSYKGSLYSMSDSGWFLKLFKWQVQDEQGWQEIDSHPIYLDGVEKLGGEDFFFASGGGRYLCITHVNSLDYHFHGRIMVVYDLEESKWHYHTTQGDGTYGSITALVCKRGKYHNILDSAFGAVWLKDASLLQLPGTGPSLC